VDTDECANKSVQVDREKFKNEKNLKQKPERKQNLLGLDGVVLLEKQTARRRWVRLAVHRRHRLAVDAERLQIRLMLHCSLQTQKKNKQNRPQGNDGIRTRPNIWPESVSDDERARG
jgi:hypothetical protein